MENEARKLNYNQYIKFIDNGLDDDKLSTEYWINYIFKYLNIWVKQCKKEQTRFNLKEYKKYLAVDPGLYDYSIVGTGDNVVYINKRFIQDTTFSLILDENYHEYIDNALRKLRDDYSFTDCIYTAVSQQFYFIYIIFAHNCSNKIGNTMLMNHMFGNDNITITRFD